MAHTLLPHRAMERIGRTIGVVADFTFGTGIVVLHMFLAGRDRHRAEAARGEPRDPPDGAWRRAVTSSTT